MTDSHSRGLFEKELSYVLNNTDKVEQDNQKIEFDRLKMYFGEPYKLSENLIIYEPRIGDILEQGEKDFFKVLNMFISHPTQFRLQLWDSGIDWNKVSDYEMFYSLVLNLPKESTKLLFGDVDFTLFKPHEIPLTEEQEDENEKNRDDPKKQIKPSIVLINVDQKIIIEEHHYKILAEYLRAMFNIYPKVEKARGKSTKEAIIQEERENMKRLEEKGDSNKSFLLPLISACVNHPGFKYKLQELRDVGIVQFMDSVQRLQVYEASVALNHGAYSGMCDMSKVDKNLFNFMRDLDREYYS